MQHYVLGLFRMAGNVSPPPASFRLTGAPRCCLPLPTRFPAIQPHSTECPRGLFQAFVLPGSRSRLSTARWSHNPFNGAAGGSFRSPPGVSVAGFYRSQIQARTTSTPGIPGSDCCCSRIPVSDLVRLRIPGSDLGHPANAGSAFDRSRIPGSDCVRPANAGSSPVRPRHPGCGFLPFTNPGFVLVPSGAVFRLQMTR